MIITPEDDTPLLLSDAGPGLKRAFAFVIYTTPR
jgi:hypothetical protein